MKTHGILIAIVAVMMGSMHTKATMAQVQGFCDKLGEDVDFHGQTWDLWSCAASNPYPEFNRIDIHVAKAFQEFKLAGAQFVCKQNGSEAIGFFKDHEKEVNPARSIDITIFRLGNAATLWTNEIIQQHVDHANQIWNNEAGRIWNWNGVNLDNLEDPNIEEDGKAGNVRDPSQDGAEIDTICNAAAEKRKDGSLPVILIHHFVDAEGQKTPQPPGFFWGITRVPGGGKNPGDCVVISYQAHWKTDAPEPNAKPGHVLAHELGHVLCLEHPDDHQAAHGERIGEENLMWYSKFDGEGNVKGQQLTQIQVKQAEECAQRPNAIFTERDDKATHHEVWSAEFDKNCRGSVDAYINPADQYDRPVIKVAFFSHVGPPKIPTVSEWGLVVIGLLLLTGGRIYFRRRRAGVFTENK